MQLQTSSLKKIIIHIFLMHTFIFCFNAERLIWTFVSRSDPQDAGEPIGGTSLLDFFTVSNVRGGAHQDHHPAAGLGLQKELQITLGSIHALKCTANKFGRLPKNKELLLYTWTLSETHSKFLFTICIASGVTSFRSRYTWKDKMKKHPTLLLSLPNVSFHKLLYYNSEPAYLFADSDLQLAKASRSHCR